MLRPSSPAPPPPPSAPIRRRHFPHRVQASEAERDAERSFFERDRARLLAEALALRERGAQLLVEKAAAEAALGGARERLQAAEAALGELRGGRGRGGATGGELLLRGGVFAALLGMGKTFKCSRSRAAASAPAADADAGPDTRQQGGALLRSSGWEGEGEGGEVEAALRAAFLRGYLFGLAGAVVGACAAAGIAARVQRSRTAAA